MGKFKRKKKEARHLEYMLGSSQWLHEIFSSHERRVTSPFLAWANTPLPLQRTLYIFISA